MRCSMGIRRWEEGVREAQDVSNVLSCLFHASFIRAILVLPCLFLLNVFLSREYHVSLAILVSQQAFHSGISRSFTLRASYLHPDPFIQIEGDSLFLCPTPATLDASLFCCRRLTIVRYVCWCSWRIDEGRGRDGGLDEVCCEGGRGRRGKAGLRDKGERRANAGHSVARY